MQSLSNDQVHDIVVILHQFDGLSKQMDTFYNVISLLNAIETPFFAPAPSNEYDFQSRNPSRHFEMYSGSMDDDLESLVSEIGKEISMSDIVTELGYGCTVDRTHCKEILSIFEPLDDVTISKLLGAVVGTRNGLGEAHNTYATFVAAILNSHMSDSPQLTTWNRDVLVDSINELAPSTNWVHVMECLDHEGFNIPDGAAFYLLISIYARACKDPFPLHAVCGSLWKNTEGQISFLKHAISAPADAFTFAHSSRRLGLNKTRCCNRICHVTGPNVDYSRLCELYSVVDALSKLARRPGSPESLQQLIEVARNNITGYFGKDEKVKLSEDKKVLSTQVSTASEIALVDPNQVAVLFSEWCQMCDHLSVGDAAYIRFVTQLQQDGLLKGDDNSECFFRIITELAVTHSLVSEQIIAPGGSSQQSTQESPQQTQISYFSIDSYTKLVAVILKYSSVEILPNKVNILSKILSVTMKAIQKDAEEKKASFNPRPYFRLYINWLYDLTTSDGHHDGSNFQELIAFANAFHLLQPLKVPAWSFAWLELASHRNFMPKLLICSSQKGWPLFQRLLVDLFKFMEPYLRNAELPEPVHILYKGTMRVLLVLLHDFPEFLCDYHFSFCDVIPSSCIQMRNVILSAFPRNMRLPDPSTPNLKIDLLAEISIAPRIMSDVDGALKTKQLKTDVDEYLKRPEGSSFLSDLKQKLLLPQNEASVAGTRYNVPLINSLVIYVGIQAVQQLQLNKANASASIQQINHTPTTDIFQIETATEMFRNLIASLDTEGRYLLLNAIANQLRYPNSHTHYFSFIILYLFAEATQEIIQEQITRVLLERLIVNRPHPWGLLITFIELIKNPRYNFWNRSFTHCAPEIKKLFESVARSCGGKAVDEGISVPEGSH